MKSLYKMCVGLVLVLATMNLQAQDATSGSLGSGKQTEEYLGVSAVGKTFSTKWRVEVDFGQAFQWSARNKDILRDEAGNIVSFNSPIDAINFLNTLGWEVVTASGDEEYFYALMRRKI